MQKVLLITIGSIAMIAATLFLHASINIMPDTPLKVEPPEPMVRYLPPSMEWKELGEQQNSSTAYIFYTTNDIYACNILMNMERLREYPHQQRDFVVILTNGVSVKYLELFKQQQMRIILKEPWIQPQTSEDVMFYSDSLTKLFVFQDFGYDTVVYMDSDCFLMQSIDQLFSLPS